MTAVGGALAAGLAMGAPAVVAPAAAYAGHGRDADPSLCDAVVTADVVLHHDVVCAGNGPRVTAPGVTLDLGGHTLRGAGSVGVKVATDSETPVRVVNGTITGFGTGVDARASVTLDDMTVTGVAQGVWGLPDHIGHYTIGLVDSEFDGTATAVTSYYFTLMATRTTWSGNGTAVRLPDSHSPATITDSVFRDNHMGVSTHQDDRIVVAHSRFSGNGLAMDFYQSRDVEVTDNLVVHNGTGLWTGGPEAQRGTISGNRFLENDKVGAMIGDGTASVLTQTSVSGNLFRGNGAAGLWLQGKVTADGSTISDNLFVGNGYDPHGLVDEKGAPLDDGLHAWVPATAGTVTLTGNRAVHNAGHGIEAAVVVDGGGNVEVANGAGDGFPTPTP